MIWRTHFVPEIRLYTEVPLTIIQSCLLQLLCHSGWPVNDPDKKEVCFDTMFFVIPDIAVIRQEDIR